MPARRCIVTLSAEADRRYMYQMRKDGYCPMPPPAWLDLLGWTAAALVFGSLGVIAYNKKVARRCSASNGLMPPLSLCQLFLPLAPLSGVGCTAHTDTLALQSLAAACSATARLSCAARCVLGIFALRWCALRVIHRALCVCCVCFHRDWKGKQRRS